MEKKGEREKQVMVEQLKAVEEALKRVEEDLKSVKAE